MNELYKAIGYGVVLFLAMLAVFWIVTVGFHITEEIGVYIRYVLLVMIVWTLSWHFRIYSLKEGFEVGFIWLTTYVILDYTSTISHLKIIISRFKGGDLSFYYEWPLYLWYLIIFLVPVLYPKLRRKRQKKL